MAFVRSLDVDPVIAEPKIDALLAASDLIRDDYMAVKAGQPETNEIFKGIAQTIFNGSPLLKDWSYLMGIIAIDFAKKDISSTSFKKAYKKVEFLVNKSYELNRPNN